MKYFNHIWQLFSPTEQDHLIALQPFKKFINFQYGVFANYIQEYNNQNIINAPNFTYKEIEKTIFKGIELGFFKQQTNTLRLPYIIQIHPLFHILLTKEISKVKGYKEFIESVYQEYYNILSITIDDLLLSKSSDKLLTAATYMNFELANLRNVLWVGLDNSSGIINYLIPIFEFLKSINKYEKALNLNLKIYAHLKKLKAKNTSYTRFMNDYIVVISNIGYCYKNLNQNEEALKYYQKVITLQDSTLINKNYPREIGISHQNIGVIYSKKNNIKKATYHYEQALIKFQEDDDSNSIGQIYLNIGTNYALRRQFNDAIKYYQKAIPFFEAGNDRLKLADCYLNLASMYDSIFEDQESINFYNKATPIFIKYDQQYKLGELYQNISSLYNRNKQFEQCINLNKMALEIFIPIDDTDKIGKSYINIGCSYRELGVYETSDNYFEMALEVINPENYDLIGQVYQNMAITALDFSYYAESLKKNQLANAYFIKSGNLASLANTYQNIGTVYMEMKYFDDGVENFEKAIELYSRLKEKISIATCYLNLANLYSRFKEYKTSNQLLLIALNYNHKDYFIIGNIYFLITANYFYLDKYTKAISAQKKALVFYIKANNIEKIVDTIISANIIAGKIYNFDHLSALQQILKNEVDENTFIQVAEAVKNYDVSKLKKANDSK